MKYVNTILLTTLTISLLLTGCYNYSDAFPLLYQNTIESSITKTGDMHPNNSENSFIKTKQLEINNLEKEYSEILDSKVDFTNMSKEEIDKSQEIISNWNKLSLNFKSKYIKQKKNLEENILSHSSKEKIKSSSKQTIELKSSYNTGITYENITENPDKYLDCKVTLTGKIVYPFGANPENDMKIEIDNNEMEPVFVYYDPEIIQLNFRKNQTITIRGYFVKTVSDLSMINGETKIPRIYANYIDIA